MPSGSDAEVQLELGEEESTEEAPGQEGEDEPAEKEDDPEPVKEVVQDNSTHSGIFRGVVPIEKSEEVKQDGKLQALPAAAKENAARQLVTVEAAKRTNQEEALHKV